MTAFQARVTRILPLVLLAACGSREAPVSVTTRDSAGVTIVEHPAGAVAAAPVWTLGPSTVTIAHGATADEYFTRINGARRFSDGRIVVVSVEAGGVRPLLYRADGAFERALGGVGDGPGEFRAAAPIECHAGDTLCIFDFSARRITRLTPDGIVSGTADVSRLGSRTVGIPSGMMANGRLVSVPFVLDLADGGPPIFRLPGTIVTIGPGAQRLDTVTTGIPGWAMYAATFKISGTEDQRPVPAGYGARTLILTLDDQVVVATNETSDIVSYSLPWAPQRIVRFGDPRIPVDAVARQAHIDSLLQEIEQMPPTMAAVRDPLRDVVKRTLFADSMPYYTDAREGADGALWLLEPRSVADSTRTFLVIGPDGKLTARVSLPPAAQLLWASASEVLVSLRDEDDVPRVELHAILKPGAPEQ